jgi:hypothetical protein
MEYPYRKNSQIDGVGVEFGGCFPGEHMTQTALIGVAFTFALGWFRPMPVAPIQQSDDTVRWCVKHLARYATD